MVYLCNGLCADWASILKQVPSPLYVVTGLNIPGFVLHGLLKWQLVPSSTYTALSVLLIHNCIRLTDSNPFRRFVTN